MGVSTSEAGAMEFPEHLPNGGKALCSSWQQKGIILSKHQSPTFYPPFAQVLASFPYLGYHLGNLLIGIALRSCNMF